MKNRLKFQRPDSKGFKPLELGVEAQDELWGLYDAQGRLV